MTQEYRSSWTDEKLDRLANTVSELSDSLISTKKIVESNARAIEAMGNKFDPYLAAMVAGQIRLQENAERNEARLAKIEEEAAIRKIETEQQKAESDQRFNVLLAEVRYLIHDRDVITE
jgi:uncharacterized protein YciW